MQCGLCVAVDELPGVKKKRCPPEEEENKEKKQVEGQSMAGCLRCSQVRAAALRTAAFQMDADLAHNNAGYCCSLPCHVWRAVMDTSLVPTHMHST